ncbi:MAG: YiiX/YebB-like N1pC/P60 family cysteine hydrolase [Bacillota bacterium]|nr:YiiX/YebB-like N1pC/P60 family cysteine hydrolase [Bacillota bacterium]
MIGNQRFRLILFPVLSLCLFLAVILSHTNLLFNNHDSVVFTYTENFMRGQVGSGYGSAQTSKFPEETLLPGDIILGGYPNCAYGRFSHAGLYLGDKEVLEGYVDSGLSIQPLEHYLNYSDLCVLRVQTDNDVRAKAMEYALGFEGRCFYPVAFKPGDRFWNCSKIIWKAYMDEGINLDPYNDLWIAPESFCQSAYVEKLYEKGNSP